MHNPILPCAFALFALNLVFPKVETTAYGDSAPVGMQKQLLVDDYVIAEKSGVQRALGRVTKENGGQPIMTADKPWEDDQFGFYGTVMYDEGKFRMWYHPYAYAVAYAESEDGLNWVKPEWDMYYFSIETAEEFRPREGAPLDWTGTANNIIGVFGDGFTCFRDPHETNPHWRYKACYGPTSTVCATMSHSSDGIHWLPDNGGQPITGRAADTYNQMLWDEAAQTYRLLTRTDYYSPSGGEVRGTRMMVNPDVKNNPTGWTTVENWKFDQEGTDEYQRRQIYAITDWIYEGVHFGLMAVYEYPAEPPQTLRTTDIDHYSRHEEDVINFYIGTSRDGTNWDATWVYAEQPLVPRGPDGSFDKDMIFCSSNIVTYKDKHFIYYTGYQERHWWVPRQPSIGLATLPLDRFVSLSAEGQGAVTTKAFTLEGDAIIINAVTAPGGSVRAALLDSEGVPLEGYELSDAFAGDELRHLLTFGGSSSLLPLVGEVVSLQFILDGASIYSFQIVPEASVTIPGDANRNGTVDEDDAEMLAANWLKSAGATWSMGDFNADGAVNDLDAASMSANWHVSFVSANVPESSPWLPLSAVMIAFLLRRQKRSFRAGSAALPQFTS